MLSEERQARILNLVNQKKSMTIQELIEQLNISESTIRRDLAELDSKELLQKVYGGAIAKNVGFISKEESVDAKREYNKDAKVKIAKHAASLIENGDFVYLDAGTTTELMIDYITATDVVFVTNAFLHAKKLSDRGFVTYMLGGLVKKSTEAVVGEEVILALEKYHFTKGFWGTNAISYRDGCSTPDVSEALVKQVSMARTNSKFVLCDVSKFYQLSCVKFAEFSDATIITSELENKLAIYRKYPNILEVK